eukprot:6697657-Pyramimonas_sp.AAC.2
MTPKCAWVAFRELATRKGSAWHLADEASGWAQSQASRLRAMMRDVQQMVNKYKSTPTKKIVDWMKAHMKVIQDSSNDFRRWGVNAFNVQAYIHPPSTCNRPLVD